MANSLFTVESPPLLDPHSDARKVTLNFLDDGSEQLISLYSSTLVASKELEHPDS